jgi:hypothetical protein
MASYLKPLQVDANPLRTGKATPVDTIGSGSSAQQKFEANLAASLFGQPLTDGTVLPFRRGVARFVARGSTNRSSRSPTGSSYLTRSSGGQSRGREWSSDVRLTFGDDLEEAA